MASYSHSMAGQTWRFDSLRELMAKATPARSGDYLAGVAAGSDAERAAAQMTLANVPLKTFLQEALIPYESDEVTRLIIDTHDAQAFAPVSHLTVGGFRDWLLCDDADEASLTALAPGLTPEMVAAVSKIMRIQDLVLVAQKTRVVTRFRNTQGLRGRMSTRLQPNHPTDDPAGIAASVVDGLLYGNGDAMIGINPATDSMSAVCTLLEMLDAVIQRYEIPTQSCVLTHVTSSIAAIERGAPLDLVFQSIAGTEAANASFGVSLKVLQEGYEAGLSLKRGTLGNNLMYFETGQGSALSANANHGVDQQTCETRAYAVARHFNPFLVNTVVGFIGPEYLSTGGHVLFAHYQQGMTDYLAIALLHHSEGVAVTDALDVTPAKHLDLGQLHLAARINISEWQNNKQSKQYISFIKGKNGKKVSDYFRDFIGCQEGVDGPGETRTLLKAFSDFVESEDLPEEQAREKTKTLVGYASGQAKLGEPITLEELSGLIDEERPKAFYEHIRNKDYGMAPEFPADKRTLSQFQRFTGRAEGLSISFEAHLLGSKIEYDEGRDMLIIRQLPTQLKDQLKRRQD
ncbi:nucleoid-associated protein YejK [Stutzerimonas stutzeri]|nr:nucleoid-associated protein YejK [Stutzerimonas stutzeri]